MENIIKGEKSDIAIVYQNQKLSYQELNAKVKCLAGYLAQHYQNEPIGFCLDRGPENIIVMLAILNSGNFYVPLDKSYPCERLKFIVTETKLRLVITNINK